jgi:tRNA(Met) cytidine acetyltransferase
LTGKSLIDWFTKRQAQISHRQLLLISGDASWCLERVKQLLLHARSPTLLLSKTVINLDDIDKQSFVTVCQISQYKQHLGTQYDIVIYNAFDGLKPNALYAVEGAIGKSGLLVLLCPQLENWAEYEAIHPGIAFSFEMQHTTSLFIKRMQNILLNDKSVASINQLENHLPFSFISEQLQNDELQLRDSERSHPQIELSTEQQLAFNDSLKNMKTNKSIGLVTAKRGRGKSTLLGRLAAEIVLSGDAAIYITAPHINNAQRAQVEFKKAIRHFALKIAPDIQKGGTKHTTPALDFIAPDQLYHLPEKSILIVDEAAAIAPSILLYACNKFTHVVMATTVAGYEGSGLGFNIRVLPKLRELSASLHQAELDKPLRWFEGDALEALFARIFAPFLSDLTLPAIQSKQRISQSHQNIATTKQFDTHYHQLNRKWLITYESILTQIVELLTQSHYQTTPDDLMRILDATDQHLAILSSSDDLTNTDVLITAVAIVAHEGDISFATNDPLLEGILCSQRRVNGHLVAQNLTTTFCEAWFMTAKSWRISRIAVVPELRRLGLGQCLLEHIKQSAEKAKVEYLSTSFGLTNELLSFWYSQNYRLIKVGARRDTSSGEHSGIMFASLSKIADHQFSSLHTAAVSDLDYIFQHVIKLDKYSDSVLLTPNLIQQQHSEAASLSHCSSVANSIHQRRIDQFKAQKRSFTNAAASIYAQLQKNDRCGIEHLQILFKKAHQKNLSKEEKQRILFELRHSL